MIFGFASGEFQYMDSSVFTHWSDRDGYPVSNRNYAHEVFRYDEDLEETPENISDELDDYFGKGEWRFVDDGTYSIVEADDTTSAWPFIVRRRITLVLKYHSGVHGWVEKPYDLFMATEEMMAPMVEPDVFMDCNE